MQKLIWIVALTGALLGLQAQALAQCEVLVEAIAGTYEGDCKKGQANGNGIAKGIDTYEGEFKKGLPHGQGTYTWANGDVFVGEFSKGEKDGAGTLTRADGTVQEGYWSEDDYIGKEKTPYAVINKDITINRITFNRISDGPNKVDFKFSRMGKPVMGRNLTLVGGYGVIMVETDFVKTAQIYEYPFQGGVNFSALGTRSVGGGGGGTGDWISGTCEIRISQPGYWEVTFEMQGNE